MQRDAATTAPSLRRLAGIEGLRGVAASSVLAYHVWFYGAAVRTPDVGPFTKLFDNMRSGVTLFFVLSGFLLFRPFAARAWRGESMPSVRSYFLNRSLRIVPAYVTILLLVALLVERRLLTAPLQLAANMLFLQNYVPGYLYGPGIVPAWSLCVEVVFYAVLPLLGLLAIAIGRRRGPGRLSSCLAPVALMVAIGLAAKGVEPFMGREGRHVWEAQFPIHADWFAAGMAVAAVRVRWEERQSPFFRGWRSTALVLALLLSLLGAKLDYSGALTQLQAQTPTAVACALILAVVVFPRRGSLLVRFLDSRPIFAVGLASYSLFLWHDPIVRGLRRGGLSLDGASGLPVNLLVVATLAGVASALTYRFVERPALALKHSWVRSKPQPPEPEPQPREPQPLEPDVPAVLAVSRQD
ncbi:MAG TPA: acyltransferase [Gaiellaceae bacterium]|nr:acyltransferase [Gaiellaceae bacterium]